MTTKKVVFPGTTFNLLKKPRSTTNERNNVTIWDNCHCSPYLNMCLSVFFVFLPPILSFHLLSLSRLFSLKNSMLKVEAILYPWLKELSNCREKMRPFYICSAEHPSKWKHRTRFFGGCQSWYESKHRGYHDERATNNGFWKIEIQYMLVSRLVIFTREGVYQIPKDLGFIP
jgi:hypothetical protein